MSSNGTEIRLRKPILYFDNVDIESVYEAKSAETSANNELDKLKGDLLSLAMSTPKDITPKGEKPVEYIKEEVDRLIEDLYDAFNKYFESNLVNQLIDEWKYSYGGDSKELYDNCKTDDEVNKNAFPKDEHEEIKRDLNKFTFAPPDDNIEDAIQRSVRNLYLNNELSNFITDKYIIIMNDKIYSDYDGQFIFKTKEDAEEVLKKKFDFHTYDYISKEFIENHPEFFKSVIRLMKFLYYDEEYINNFTEALNKLLINNYKMDMDLLDTIYQGLNKVIYERLYDICKIRIIKLSDLIK
jgi:hypothetical protein